MNGTERETGSAGPENQGHIPPARALRRAVLDGDIEAARRALADGASVDEIDPATGLAALHLAAGLNDLAMTRFLVGECSASFFPDRFGRWPTLVAAENHVSDALSDYIVEQEAAWLASHPEQAP